MRRRRCRGAAKLVHLSLGLLSRESRELSREFCWSSTVQRSAIHPKLYLRLGFEHELAEELA
jgi:hypothetical protein